MWRYSRGFHPPGPIARYGPRGLIVRNMFDVRALLALGQILALPQGGLLPDRLCVCVCKTRRRNAINLVATGEAPKGEESPRTRSRGRGRRGPADGPGN